MMITISKIAALTLILSCTTSFAVTLGHVSVADPMLGNRSLTYEQVNDYAVVEGDILLGKIADITSPNAVIIPKVGGSRWLDGIVPFELAEDLPLMNKLAVLQAITHWQKYTSLEFVERTSKNRSKFHDYIAFVPAEGTTCSSFVGKHGGRQDINLAPRCNTMNTVHEIGHALGLWHEQSRADRANYIQIVWENIEDDQRHNFEQHLTDGKDIGAYDYQSIMHYGPYAFSKNGKKTLIPLVDGADIGQRDHLSEKDIAAIAAMYPGS